MSLVPPLLFFCVAALARLPHPVPVPAPAPIPATDALLDALPDAPHPCLWATLAQLVHPLPPRLHDYNLPLSHPALPRLQKIPDSPHFSLVTLVSLPRCTRLRDDDVAGFRALPRLLALDLRGCTISSYALVALARGLTMSDPTRFGTWRLRLLSLHGCPNIDDDALSSLAKFPLLSAVDLRFTRCTPNAVNAHLSPLGFRPADNNSLFHPAPLPLALCSLEKIALTASNSISLYSCPLQSVFRLHIDEFDHHPSHTKKVVPVGASSTSSQTIRTISSAEDTVVFIPPLRKQATKESTLPPKLCISSSAVSVAPTSSSIDQSVSNASSFYENTPGSSKHSRKNVLPLSAQAVKPSRDGELDPLAVARSPPPWETLDALVLSNPFTVVTYCQRASDKMKSSPYTQPIARFPGQSLNSLKVDRGRLHKRGSDAVADIVHQFTNKRPKIESEFMLAKARAKASVKSRNPFTRCAKSVFAENGTNACDKPRSLVCESPKEIEPDVRLQGYCFLVSKTVEGTLKPLKPITSLKPPILPREHASNPEPN